MPDDPTIKVSFDDEEFDRLRAVADDPADLLHDAGMHRVLVEETITARLGDDGSGSPPTDPLASDTPVAPVGALLGFEVAAAGDGEATVVLETGREHANPMGTLHGGVLCDLGDAAMGIAYASTLGPDESFTTLELHVNYLRPVWEDRLTAEGRVVNRGRTVGLVECDIRNAEEQLVGRLSSTCLTLRGEAAAGR